MRQDQTGGRRLERERGLRGAWVFHAALLALVGVLLLSGVVLA